MSRITTNKSRPMNAIPYGRQDIHEEDIQSLIAILQSDYLTQGPRITAFEEAFAEYIGSPYAIAVANGTAALHLSALALGIKEGQKVITSSITFAASANCALYAGGEIEFVDIDPKTFLIDIEQVREKLIAAPRGTYAGIVPIDFAGQAVDLEALRQLADQHDCWILEDACHAPGGYFTDSQEQVQLCGNGAYADAAIFSFHPVKHIACGEGGMITTASKELYDKLIMLRTHGITRNPDLLEEQHGGWYYEMQDLGFNYRLSDLHAGLGLSQLGRAEAGLGERREIAKRYNEAFAGTKVNIPFAKLGHAYHLYVIQVEDRKGLYDYLRSHKIYVQVHYIPVHLQPYYKRLGWKKGDLPQAEAYYNRCLSLPMFPTLTEEEQQFVIDHVLTFVNKD